MKCARSPTTEGRKKGSTRGDFPLSFLFLLPVAVPPRFAGANWRERRELESEEEEAMKTSPLPSFAAAAATTKPPEKAFLCGPSSQWVIVCRSAALCLPKLLNAARNLTASCRCLCPRSVGCNGRYGGGGVIITPREWKCQFVEEHGRSRTTSPARTGRRH